MKRICYWIMTVVVTCAWGACSQQPSNDYAGKYISGNGDVEYLELLDKACRMMRPDGELENLSMLYFPSWNGFVEGPTWDAWWIQNSFGPTYTMLPFMDKAYQTFVANSQALWFNLQGDGERKDGIGYVAPKGSLCDCARPDWVIYRQGDGRHRIHDWGYGFTAAGIILQSELLLISQNEDSIRKYLPMLEEAAEFIDSRRDPEKNIYLVGPAGNLLAPSYAGSGKQLPDGSYEKAYLAEISVNYLAGLNRLIELEKKMKRTDKALLYEERKEKVKSGLKYLMTDEGYFIRALALDGTKHGEFGAEKYGYFDVAPNHDAMAFRIADDQQAQAIYRKIKSIPGLRPNDLILPNYPGYDDMYEYNGLFNYGTWVNGGHWTTNEARMQLGYYRVGAWQDAKAGFKRILNLAPVFRMDNNLTNFGADLYQPKQPINVVYDSWGAPGGFLRGLFEYLYTADGLTLVPHIPEGITQLQQHFPIYFGDNRIYITVNGNGPITSVTVNGKVHEDFDALSVRLSPSPKPAITLVHIGMAQQPAVGTKVTMESERLKFPDTDDFRNIESLLNQPGEVNIDKPLLKKVATYYQQLAKANLTWTYEYRHAQLILESVQSVHDRLLLRQQGALPELAPESQHAADKLYITTIRNLCDGLQKHLRENNRTEAARLGNELLN
ncbi:MAG: hypothetical protein LBT78_09950, partial [Tannerella sp.]|nr:hypothetical protein [Tannerella sp.]